MSNFEKAVSQSCLEWASSLPETCEYTLSAASEKYFDKLLKRMEHGGFRPVSKHTLRFILIAAIIAALLAVITIGANIGEQSFEIIPNGDMAQYSVIDPAEPLLAIDLTVNYTVPGFKLKDTMYDPNDIRSPAMNMLLITVSVIILTVVRYFFTFFLNTGIYSMRGEVKLCQKQLLKDRFMFCSVFLYCFLFLLRKMFWLRSKTTKYRFCLYTYKRQIIIYL